MSKGLLVYVPLFSVFLRVNSLRTKKIRLIYSHWHLYNLYNYTKEAATQLLDYPDRKKAIKLINDLIARNSKLHSEFKIFSCSYYLTKQRIYAFGDEKIIMLIESIVIESNNRDGELMVMVVVIVMVVVVVWMD